VDSARQNMNHSNCTHPPTTNARTHCRDTAHQAGTWPQPASVVDNMHSSWYPLVLKELETKHPDIFKEITSEVIGRNAERQVAAQSATNPEEPTHG
jgi:hypothetical protein